jgi:hypothetical protein
VGINLDEQNAESMGRNESTAECKRFLRQEGGECWCEAGKGSKARSYVSAGVGNLQIWRVTENIGTRQQRTADRRWSSKFGTEWG